ncbi:MAG TPA: MFS transporter, partial [Deferribacteraceae bacterium]|nr:MFS transporter [Deferribacteraceae bacterium]
MKFFILALIYLSGLAAPVNQFKVPPMMQRLISELDISLAASGWLMSAFAL